MKNRKKQMSKLRQVLEAKKTGGNPVAKNLNKFNKAATHRDRKKDDKKGYEKHKNNTAEEVTGTLPMDGPADVVFAVDEGIVDTVMKSKILNRKNYASATKELEKRMKADSSKTKGSHAHDVAKYHRNVDARKLAAEESSAASYEPPKSLDQIEKDYSKGAKKPVNVNKYKAALPDAAAIKRRKAIEKHQAKKQEKDYWDDDRDYTKGCPLLEKLNPVDGIGKYVKDFAKSDAPQFKGKSSSKRRQMAVASYLGQKRKKLEKSVPESIEYNSDMGAMDWGTPAGTDYMKDVTPGQKNPKEDPVRPLDQSTLIKLNVKDKHTDCTRTAATFAKEETEAAETKAKYRSDNSDEAPVLGDYALTKQDIAEMEHELDKMGEEEMEEYGFIDDDDDYDYESDTDWDDFDMEDVEVVHQQGIDEVLSVQGRLKRRFSARKNKQKLKVARNIALRRGSTPDRLKKRATRGARSMVYKRLLKGRDKSTMPPAEKARFEKLIGMYQPLIQRFAVRMLPKMRKMELHRMANRKGKGSQKSKKYKAAGKKVSSQKSTKFKIKKR